MESQEPSASPPHVAPKFDIYGWEIKGREPARTDRTAVRMPPGWSLEPSKETQQTLLARRRKENIPDISFDLDGDGKVGGQDLVIGKLFDKDKDGRLNTSERKEADKAVAEGIADRFVWGVEQAAPSRPYRLLQKRGQIVDSEDFSQVAKTYPVKTRSVSPVVKTYGELKEKRAQERLESLKVMREQWESKHPQQMIPETQEYRRASLPYRTYSEKKAQESCEARLKAGLLPIHSGISDKPIPSLAYVALPKYRSKSQMKTAKHEEALQELEAKQNTSFVCSDKRLEIREKEIEDMMCADGKPGKTYAEVKEKLRQEAVAHNAATFSQVKVGIHGQELPKFSDHCPEYWKQLSSYVQDPGNNSLLELKQQVKYYAPRDVYKLADKEESPAPPDPFKAVHVPRLRITERLPEKPTSHVPVPYQPRDLSDPDAPQPAKHTYRWTTLMQVFHTKDARGSTSKPREGVNKSLLLDE